MKEDIVRKLNGEGIGRNDPEMPEYDKMMVDCWAKITDFNLTPMYDRATMRKAFSRIVGYEVDDSCTVLPPFRCDLGFNIRLGKRVLINYNCTFLDVSEISIGDDTMIGPDCRFYTACHYLEPEKRLDRKCYGLPIRIGKNCWIGGNVTIVPGVTIGDNVVVGAGSVVTKDVPNDTVVVGNPAHPIERK